MRFNLLGPLEAFSDGNPVGLGGFNQRATVGFLLLHANEVVPTSKLIHALWGYETPATSRKMVQNAVSGLRRIIERHAGPDGPVRLTTTPPGYCLTVADGHLDLWHFRRQVDLGRAEIAAGHQEAGIDRLRSALSLWRGPALADLVEPGIAWPELKAITGLRMSVFEDYAQEALNRGRHHEVLGELEEMAASEPTGERLCGLLMVALYRCGRQHDALAAYQRTRAALLDNFGLDPGRELRALEVAVLNQDPALTFDARPYWHRTARRSAGVGRCEHRPAGTVSTARRPQTVLHRRRHP
ncbi:Transcriptional regulatory protein EmbR [Streptomyces sp. enrichment culture]|uniref:AfsR/SARP family transcriptional regulator n=1 Tax=Streptomyces sp. enrichment culture TaxID=1795815 RepID=UPI003F553248